MTLSLDAPELAREKADELLLCQTPPIDKLLLQTGKIKAALTAVGEDWPPITDTNSLPINRDTRLKDFVNLMTPIGQYFKRTAPGGSASSLLARLSRMPDISQAHPYHNVRIITIRDVERNSALSEGPPNARVLLSPKKNKFMGYGKRSMALLRRILFVGKLVDAEGRWIQ